MAGRVQREQRSDRLDITDLSIAIGGDIAFSHSLNRNGGRWVRWTACYRRIDGWWRIVHEHVSVPVDMREANAVFDLEPYLDGGRRGDSIGGNPRRPL